LVEATGLPPKQALHALLEKHNHSIKPIAEEIGIERNYIYQALAYFGIRRDYDHSSYMKQWYKENPDRIPEIVGPAHEASRGRTQSRAELCFRAQKREEAGRMTPLEGMVASVFEDFGIDYVPQMAFGVFNVDLGILSHQLAVEVNPGNWHTADAKQAQDCRKRRALEQAGWTVVYLEGERDNIYQQAIKLARMLSQSH
jgi:very-short-patch-repair endonuclease